MDNNRAKRIREEMFELRERVLRLEWELEQANNIADTRRERIYELKHELRIIKETLEGAA